MPGIVLVPMPFVERCQDLGLETERRFPPGAVALTVIL
jgi:hypothetical protein